MRRSLSPWPQRRQSPKVRRDEASDDDERGRGRRAAEVLGLNKIAPGRHIALPRQVDVEFDNVAEVHSGARQDRLNIGEGPLGLAQELAGGVALLVCANLPRDVYRSRTRRDFDAMAVDGHRRGHIVWIEMLVHSGFLSARGVKNFWPGRRAGGRLGIA